MFSFPFLLLLLGSAIQASLGGRLANVNIKNEGGEQILEFRRAKGNDATAHTPLKELKVSAGILVLQTEAFGSAVQYPAAEFVNLKSWEWKAPQERELRDAQYRPFKFKVTDIMQCIRDKKSKHIQNAIFQLRISDRTYNRQQPLRYESDFIVVNVDEDGSVRTRVETNVSEILQHARREVDDDAVSVGARSKGTVMTTRTCRTVVSGMSRASARTAAGRSAPRLKTARVRTLSLTSQAASAAGSEAETPVAGPEETPSGSESEDMYISANPEGDEDVDVSEQEEEDEAVVNGDNADNVHASGERLTEHESNHNDHEQIQQNQSDTVDEAEHNQPLQSHGDDVDSPWWRSIWEQYRWYIVAGAAVIVIVLIVACILVVRCCKNRKSKQINSLYYASPTKQPTETPTKAPSKTPTKTPTKIPTSVPSEATDNPTQVPTAGPTATLAEGEVGEDGQNDQNVDGDGDGDDQGEDDQSEDDSLAGMKN